MEGNKSFSKQVPNLQLVIDQTSLGLFKKCPRKYMYRMILGYVPMRQNFHLTFGLMLHEGCEKYEIAKISGANHQEALRAAVRHVLKSTWDYSLGKPWESGDPDKHRYSLVRTLVWYLDDFGANDKMETIVLKSGKPAVELSFQFTPEDFETGAKLRSHITDEEIVFSGHIDRLVMFEGAKFISDRKTTRFKLDDKYWKQYSPENQFSMYALASYWFFGIQVIGIICDAAQIKRDESVFERRTIFRSPAQLREWYADAKYWISLMGAAAEANRYPQNDTACNEYGGCPYRSVCAMEPSAREYNLRDFFRKETWDPSVARGE